MSSLEPGLHPHVSADQYHADRLTAAPTLNSSIAGLMLTASPRHAWYAHPRLGARLSDEPSEAMTVGTVAHKLVLDAGADLEILHHPDYRTTAAKAARDAATAAGKTPILIDAYERAALVAEAIEDRIAEHPDCSDFFDERSRSEVTGIWADPAGPLCRMRLDKLCESGTVYDIKTGGRGLDDETLARKIAGGLDLQAAFYVRGLTNLFPEMAGRFRWRWVFAETEAPFEIRIVEACGATLTAGGWKAGLAIERWRLCLESGVWPGFERRVTTIPLPTWADSKAQALKQAPEWNRVVIPSGAPRALPATLEIPA